MKNLIKLNYEIKTIRKFKKRNPRDKDCPNSAEDSF